MAFLIPESRDFFFRRLCRELQRKSGRDRVRFMTWVLTIIIAVMGTLTISLGS